MSEGRHSQAMLSLRYCCTSSVLSLMSGFTVSMVDISQIIYDILMPACQPAPFYEALSPNCHHAYAPTEITLVSSADLPVLIASAWRVALQVTCPGQQTLRTSCALHAGGPPRSA